MLIQIVHCLYEAIFHFDFSILLVEKNVENLFNKKKPIIKLEIEHHSIHSILYVEYTHNSLSVFSDELIAILFIKRNSLVIGFYFNANDFPLFHSFVFNYEKNNQNRISLSHISLPI